MEYLYIRKGYGIHFHKSEGMSDTALRVRDVCLPHGESSEHGPASSCIIKEDPEQARMRAIVRGTAS